MDMCVSPKSKNEVQSGECRLQNTKSEEKAHKENADFRQNNNTHSNQMSFIPVFTKKSDACHYFSDKGVGNKTKSIDRHDKVDLVCPSNSPPTRQKCPIDQNEKLSLRSVRAHTRRRSVGFEDITSLNSYLSNDKRSEALASNYNITTGTDIANKMLNSDNDYNYAYGQRKIKEINHISGLNQNSKIANNANDQTQGTCSKPLPQYKDKSSKRKSSLNRLDFIDFPATYTGNFQNKQAYRSKNSSSDEEIDARAKQQNSEFLTCSIKRKHNVSPGAVAATSKSFQKITNEAPYQSTSPTTKQKPLPKSLHNSHFKLRQHKRAHSVATQLQKLSHSAGELESLTDETNTVNKVCLSAQEFDTRDPPVIGASSRAASGTNFKKYASKLPPVNRSSSPMKNSNVDTSQSKTVSVLCDSKNNSSAAENNTVAQINASPTADSDLIESKSVNSTTEIVDEPLLSCFNLIDSFELKHIDSKSEDDLEVAESVAQLETLDISEDKSAENAARLSDDNCDSASSDGGGNRPNSILRKKFFEERRELHGILKPPPDDKFSKTPPSILKHRESSEEKETWQQSDLHSILKKSTSEDESCNSGPDIRPILKVSTDEESPGGSARPRPILKKRTSFSEECSYASYPNGELKPILKKKAPLSTDDQPRPILKGRRKSEDARSTLSEFVASRPRAYSADMGVKSNHDGLEQKTEDFCNRENQHL